jgi:hypothetical protein
LVKRTCTILSNVKDFKNIIVNGFFFKVALDTVRPFLEIDLGNKYIPVVIDHYSKWCKARTIPNLKATIAAKF